MSMHSSPPNQMRSRSEFERSSSSKPDGSSPSPGASMWTTYLLLAKYFLQSVPSSFEYVHVLETRILPFLTKTCLHALAKAINKNEARSFSGSSCWSFWSRRVRRFWRWVFVERIIRPEEVCDIERQKPSVTINHPRLT